MDFRSIFDSTTSAESPLQIQKYLISILGSAVFAWFLGIVYERFGRSLSNRRSLAIQFVPLTLATTIVISIIQSSLALSLGLVGALSIVRFRAAIKEPEELIYLFICIAIGLGFGAGQYLAVAVGISLLMIILVLVSLRSIGHDRPSLILMFKLSGSHIDLSRNVQKYLREFAQQIDLRRYHSGDQTEIVYALKAKDVSKVDSLMNNLKTQFPTAEISLLEQRDLF